MGYINSQIGDTSQTTSETVGSPGLKGETGPAGPQGLTGPRGEKGPIPNHSHILTIKVLYFKLKSQYMRISLKNKTQFPFDSNTHLHFNPRNSITDNKY